MFKVRGVCAAVLAMCGIGCSESYVKELPSEAPATKPAKVTFSGQDLKMVTLSSVAMDIPVGTVLGQASVGTDGYCSGKEQLHQKASPGPVDAKAFRDVFQDVISAAGVPVESTMQRFEGEEVRKADLQVAAVIKELILNVCYPKVYEEKALATGQAYVTVEWSVFSPIEKVVLFSSKSSGRSPKDFESHIGEIGLIREAFRDALGGLLTEPQFAKNILKADKGVADAGPATLALAQPPPHAGAIQGSLDEIRGSVVTIESNVGEGTGFAVGAGDYIVTAAHVVSGTTSVKVLGTDHNQSVYGEVVRRDVARDVALIKLQNAKFKPLYVERTIPKAGSDLYAVGSPLGHKYDFTVTRGILSSVRKENGRDYIQSDVTVLPGNSGGPLLDAQGNVVGITNSGVMFSGAPVGMNFFVPAQDVFGALAIEAK